MAKTLMGLGLICLIGLVTAGCSNSNSETVKKKVGTDDSNAGQEHSHVHGPHGGEVFELADIGVKGEWVGKYGQNLVMFYLFEQDGETEKPVKADKLVGSFKITEVKTFDIPAVNLKDGMASRFEIVDEQMALAMKTSGINLSIEIDGKKYSTNLAKDPHAH